MSRQSMMPPRNLTLTEELEKLEQQITLTLQEIDHNFSKAHRIVTGSIIPIVEQYARHSDAVWEGSKFWKQFFEASANVSLSGYEEASEDMDESEMMTEATAGQDAYGTPSSRAQEEGDEDEDDEIMSTTTNSKDRSRPAIDYEDDELDLTALNDTPTATPKANPIKSTSSSSITKPHNRSELTTPRTNPRTKQSPYLPSAKQTPKPTPKPTGPVLHHMLDKTYRVQATPHSTRRAAKPKRQAEPTRTTNTAFDSSPLSSPMVAPQLRSEYFSPRRAAPRTPGVSVHQSARKRRTPMVASARKTLFSSSRHREARKPDLDDGDDVVTTGRSGDMDDRQSHPQSRSKDFYSPYSARRETTRNVDLDWLDEDDTDTMGLDISPPKTMHFVMPTSRLTQTPAKEASRRMVEDIYQDAGIAGSIDDDSLSELRLRGEYDDTGAFIEGSPSVVRGRGVGDDEF